MKLSFIFLACSICVLRAEEENTAPANYQFNHPPSAEDYGPIIDVAVVYDDGVQLKSKSVDQEETVDKDQVIATTEAEEPSSSPKSELPKPVLVPKPRALNNFEIPVAVVYDNVNSLKTAQVSQQRPKGVRRRLKKRKQQKPKESVQEVENPTVAPEIPKPVSKAIPVRNPSQRAPIQTTTYVPVVSNAAKSKPTARERDPIVPIIESENHVYSHNGNFHYSYEGGDGTKAFSDGQLLRTEDDKAAGEGVVGGFSYTDKDGNDFSLSYTADENGYRPVGAHLPTPPPIPPAIARALAYLATATTPEPVTKPSKIKQE